MQIKADVTRTPLTVSANPDATPLGAAMLAALGTGAGTVDDLIGRWVGRGATYTPDEARAESYDALYRVYAGLYPALAASMHDLAAVGRTIGSDA